MKKSILLILFFSQFALSLSAQVWLPDNAQWVSYNEPLFSDQETYFRLYVDGDTIIDNKNCKILREASQRINISTQDTTYRNSIYGVAYEEDHRLYQVLSNGALRLIYDFNMEVGDSLIYPANSICDSLILEISNTGVETINNKAVRYQDFKLYNHFLYSEYHPFRIYEGIGFIAPTSFGYNGLFCYRSLHCGWVDPPTRFTCYSSDELIYSPTDSCGFGENIVVSTTEKISPEFKLYPNPVKDKLYFENSVELGTLEVELSSLVGKSIKRYIVNNSISSIDLSELNTGIYFLTFYSKGQAIAVKKIIKHAP